MPSVEKTVIEWLSSIAGNDYPVFGDKPQSLPESFILIDRTGGPREAKVLDRAEILIEVYHKTSRMQASDKAGEIGDALPSLLIYSDDITRANLNSTVNLPDEILKYERYQLFCDIYGRR